MTKMMPNMMAIELRSEASVDRLSRPIWIMTSNDVANYFQSPPALWTHNDGEREQSGAGKLSLFLLRCVDCPEWGMNIECVFQFLCTENCLPHHPGQQVRKERETGEERPAAFLSFS
jgi:hypothetical protein